MATPDSNLMNVADAVKDLCDWLFGEARLEPSADAFVTAYASRLAKHVAVNRLFFGTKVLHPQVPVISWKWMDGKCTPLFIPAHVYAARFQNMPDEPFVRLELGESDMIRLRTGDERIPEDWSWFASYTDYVAMADAPGGVYCGAFGWATSQNGGFTDRDVAILQQHLGPLSAIMHVHKEKLVRRFLLEAYLGRDPGSRVYQGSIARGDGVAVESVVWFSDIRGFTQMSADYDRVTVIALINQVFELTESIIYRHGGEVLKFMGDGVMAVFTPAEREWLEEKDGEASERMQASSLAPNVCHRARNAANELQAALEDFRQRCADENVPAARVGIGLHYGQCSYGNIGSSRRLDFTVIGSSVNLASRVEGLCSQLLAKTLATSEFVELDGQGDCWRNRGAHQVKGVDRPVTVYELV